MLRQSPLPPLVLGAALALGIALADPHTDRPVAAASTAPSPSAPILRNDAPAHPDGIRADPTRRPSLRRPTRAREA